MVACSCCIVWLFHVGFGTTVRFISSFPWELAGNA